MRSREGLRQALDPVDASGGHEHALHRGPVARRRLADGPVVDHELVERHRQQVAGHVVHGAFEVAAGE